MQINGLWQAAAISRQAKTNAGAGLPAPTQACTHIWSVLPESAAFWLEAHHETLEVLLAPQQVPQAVSLGTLDQRPNKHPVLAIGSTDISVIALAAQGFLQGFGTFAIGQAGELHRPTDWQAVGIDTTLTHIWFSRCSRLRRHRLWRRSRCC